MPKLIDFSNFKKEKHNKDNSYYTDFDKEIIHNQEENTGIFITVLLKDKPGKLIYSLKEAAEILGIGQEFLRRRIRRGRIKSVKLGDKPGINLIELARILSEGV